MGIRVRRNHYFQYVFVFVSAIVIDLYVNADQVFMRLDCIMYIDL